MNKHNELIALIAVIFGCKVSDIEIETGHGYQFSHTSEAHMIVCGETVFEKQYNANHCNQLDARILTMECFISEQEAAA